ncbi:MAG: hypothetical protein CBC01_08985 [Betaproteobacteria bacterium TMED41]|nr:MAG: hypothetical protein CBC01_08985 [Betaproteobacteria bacterium TMED41]
MKQKRKIKSYFWIFFSLYLFIFLFWWFDYVGEFGFLYIFSVCTFVSFFLAWASSLFVLLFNTR